MVTVQEHLLIARQLRELARELAQRGQAIAAGEMLWGAANRIILAINLQYGIMPPSQPLRRGTVIRHLDTQRRSTPALQHGLNAVGQLHGHFYNSDLTPGKFSQHTGDAEAFITALLDLPETLAIPPP